MTINTTEILEVCQILAKDRNMKVTVQQSLRGGMYAGGGAIIGGMCMGPFGLALGATLAGCYAAATSEQFKPAYQVIMDLPPAKKAQLVASVRKIVDNLDAADLQMLLLLIRADASLTTSIVNEVATALRGQCRMVVMD